MSKALLAVKLQAPAASIRKGADGAHDGVGRKAVVCVVHISAGQGTGGGERRIGFCQGLAGAGDCRGVVGAVDLNGDAAAGAVDAGDLKGLVDIVAHVQVVEGAVGRKAPGTGCIDRKGTDGANDGVGRKAVVGVVDVGAGEGAAGGDRSIGLGQGLAGAGDCRGVVGAIDLNGDGAAGTVDARGRIGLADVVAQIQAVKGAIGGKTPGPGRIDTKGADGAHNAVGREAVVGVIHVAARQRAAGRQRRIGLVKRHAGTADRGRVVDTNDHDGNRDRT